MTNDKSQARIHRFTVGIIIAITLVVIGGNVANIDTAEFNEAFGTSFGEIEVSVELLQPTKNIYTPIKKEVIRKAISE